MLLGGVIGIGLAHGGKDLPNGVLIKEVLRSTVNPSIMGGHSKMAVYESGDVALPDHESSCALILNFSASSTMKNKCVKATWCFCYSSPNGLMQNKSKNQSCYRM
jgi:hypothetical protein